MTEKVRVNLHITPEVEQTLTDLAREMGTTKTDVIRRGLRLMELVHTVQAEGRHVGFVKDRSKLDTEFVGLW
jgi:hypothetical protein